MSDYLFLMESRLSVEQARVMQRVQSAAESAGVTLYLVGGAIRDLICGYSIDDLNFVVEGKALQIVRALGRDVRVLWQDDKLQAAELEFTSGVVSSISMARTEMYSATGARSIAPAPILLDLRRRDFSINALGMSLNAQSRGLLLDPTNGAGDIKHREIRALHKRSFIDDPVRMFRAIRFRTRLQFTLEQKTEQLYQAAKESDLQQEASGEALVHELQQIARERNPVEILKALEKEKLLQAIHPRLEGDRINLKKIVAASRISQQYAPLGIHPPSFDLLLHLLMARLTAKNQAQLLKRLELKKPALAALRDLDVAARRLAKELMGKSGGSPTALFKLLSSTPSDLIILLQVAYPQAKVQSRIKAYLQKHLPLRYQLPSQELQQLGVAAGTPRHDEILDAYFYAVLEGKVRGKGDHSKFLKKLMGQKEAKPAAKERKLAVVKDRKAVAAKDRKIAVVKDRKVTAVKERKIAKAAHAKPAKKASSASKPRSKPATASTKKHKKAR